MAALMVQYGRRRGRSKKGSSDREHQGTISPPDLRQVTVLPRAEYFRIKESLDHLNKQKKIIEEAVQQREDMHLRSIEVVKSWSNTLAGQRQKKLEARKIREQIEEEQRKMTDIEEAKYQERMRKEAIRKAKARQYYQTDRVKGFHSALLLSEVLKEREAQIELKQKIQSASKDMDRQFLITVKARENEALNHEQQKTMKKKLDSQAMAEDLKKQMEKIELARERERLENTKEGEEIQRLQTLHLWEQNMEKQKQAEQKRNVMQAHVEYISNRDLVRAVDAEKQKLEEEQRQLFLSAKQKMVKLRREKEAEMFREAQVLRERIIDQRTATQLKKQTINEEEIVAKAVTEQEARREQRLRYEEEKKASMMESISEHRETMRQKQEQRDMVAHQNSRDILQAKKEADRIFLEKQQLKAQKAKEAEKVLQDHYIHQMAEKKNRSQQLKRDQQDFEAKNMDLIAEEEKQFQQYAKKIIEAAAAAERNVHPLRNAAREGIGGGLGPVIGGMKPSYLVQDNSGVQMPKYVSGATQNIKELNETIDIQRAKKRLGFMG